MDRENSNHEDAINNNGYKRFIIIEFKLWGRERRGAEDCFSSSTM